jgi:outer membrane protein OmpA-like peptidoglycan-associated protein
VTRPGKNVTTQLRVYAENEEEARENVALNGWQILSIEEQMPAMTSGSMRGMDADASADPAAFLMKITKVGEGEVMPEGDVNVVSGDSLMLKLIPGACEKIGSIIVDGDISTPESDEFTIDDITKDGNVVVVFEKNGSGCDDNGIFSANLKNIGAVYFALGKFTKELADDERAVLDSVSSGKEYVIIGHTDDVKVIPNPEYSDNFQLSVKRADFFKKFLLDKGIGENSIKTIGLGPAFPAAENKKEGQPLNRRAILYERTR